MPRELNIAKEDNTSDVLITSTVNGIHKSDTSIIKNLLITPLSGDDPIQIDNARTCHLPKSLSLVPTPQEVSTIPGLSHLAGEFPAKKYWPTIILLGRDCIQVQKHLQYVSSEDKHQLAIQTPLGWTIMGKPAQATCPLPSSPSHTPSISEVDNAFQDSATAPISTTECLVTMTRVEVHSPPKEVPVSQEDDSSSTTDQMPAGSFQQETR